MRAIAFGLLLLWPAAAAAETIVVGPGDGYAPIEAAKPGDEVVLKPGVYTSRVYLQQPPTSPIVIHAQDPTDPPVIDFGTTLVDDAPGSYTGGDRARGCWQINGANVQLSGLVFRHCRNQIKNAAGIRYYGGAIVTIRGCTFEDNDNGLTGGTQDSTAVVEYSEFAGNGNPGAGAPTHNVYNYGGSFTLRYSLLRDPVQGQNFHVRARDAVLEYNWIARPKSYPGDLMTDDDCDGSAPCVQNMLLRGNVIVQGLPDNHGQIVALYNDAAVAGSELHLRMLWNTIVIAPENASHAILVHMAEAPGTTMTAEISNNVLTGGRPLLIDASASGSATGSHNWLPAGTDPGPLTASVFGDPAGLFRDAANQDYAPSAKSSAIGAALASLAGAPDKEYFQNEKNALMYRPRATANDIGAFESTTMGPGIGLGGATTGTGAGGSSAAAGPTASASAGAGPTPLAGQTGCGCRIGETDSRVSWLAAAVTLLALAWQRARGSRGKC